MSSSSDEEPLIPRLLGGAGDEVAPPQKRKKTDDEEDVSITRQELTSQGEGALEELERLVHELSFPANNSDKAKLTKYEGGQMHTLVSRVRKQLHQLALDYAKLEGEVLALRGVGEGKKGKSVRFADTPEAPKIDVGDKGGMKALVPVTTTDDSGSDREAWEKKKSRKKKKKKSRLPKEMPVTYAAMAGQGAGSSITPPQPKPRRQLAPPVPKPKPPTAVDPSKAVVISPIDGDSGITSLAMLREVILKQLKPSLKDVNVLQMRPKLKGIAMALECATEGDRDKIINCPILEKIKVKASLARIPGETIEIVGVDKELSKEELIGELWERNLISLGFRKDDIGNDIIARFTLPCPWVRGGNMVRWIVEVPTKVKEALLKNRVVNIEWGRLEVRSHTWVTRCFNCLRFGHAKKNCPIEGQTCAHCSKVGHDSKDCPSLALSPVCGACVEKRRSLTDHSIRDNRCPEFIRELSKARR